jgi:hypothetical protein
MVTFEDITKDNFCEYQTMPSGLWHPSKFASGVVTQKSETSHFMPFGLVYAQYTDNQLRMIKSGYLCFVSNPPQEFRMSISRKNRLSHQHFSSL